MQALQRAYVAVSLASKIISGLAFLLILARVLDIQSYGLFATVIAYGGLAAAFADFGAQTRLLRGRSNSEARDYAAEYARIFGLKNGLTVLTVTAGVAVIAVGSINEPKEALVVSILFTSCFLHSYSEAIGVLLRGLQKNRLDASASLGGNLLFCLMLLPAFLIRDSMVGIAQLVLVGRVLQLTASFVAVSVLDASLFKAILKFPSRAFGQRLPIRYAADGLLSAATSQVDIIVVSYFLGLNAAAVYQLGARATSYALLPSQVLVGFHVPRIAATYIQSRQIGILRACAVLGEFALAAIGIAIAFHYIVPNVVLLIAGQGYRAPGIFWLGFSVLIFLRFLGAGVGSFLVAAGSISQRVIGQSLAICVVVVGGVVLLRDLGMNAAPWLLAASALSTLWVFAVALGRVLRRA